MFNRNTLAWSTTTMEHGHPGFDDYEEFEKRATASVQSEALNNNSQPKRVLGEIVERRRPAMAKTVNAKNKILNPSKIQTNRIAEDPEARMRQEINAENQKIIGNMSKEEIEAEVNSLKAVLPPKLIEKWCSQKKTAE